MTTSNSSNWHDPLVEALICHNGTIDHFTHTGDQPEVTQRSLSDDFA
jgi:hypothetical protein